MIKTKSHQYSLQQVVENYGNVRGTGTGRRGTGKRRRSCNRGRYLWVSDVSNLVYPVDNKILRSYMSKRIFQGTDNESKQTSNRFKSHPSIPRTSKQTRQGYFKGAKQNTLPMMTGFKEVEESSGFECQRTKVFFFSKMERKSGQSGSDLGDGKKERAGYL